MSIKENVKRAKSDFDEVYNAGIEVGKKIGGESVAPNLQDKLITENGTYTPDDGYDGIRQVEVNVVTEPILQEKMATENGEYTPDEGYDGLSKVTVQVEASGGGDNSKFVKLISGEEVSLTAEDLSGITAISRYAFAYSSLIAIEMPDSITEIGDSVCYKCSGLVSVTLSESLAAIPSNAFSSTLLTSIVLPKGIKVINSYAFDYCQKLTRVTVLGNITRIGTCALEQCKALEEVDLTACTSVPTLSNIDAFRGIPTTCKIKVPSKLYESWKSATNWSTYASQIVAVPTIKIDDDVYEIEEGMTWGEWIVSEYAPEGKFIVYVDNIRVAENNNYVVRLSDSSMATPDTVINSGDEYYQSEP